VARAPSPVVRERPRRWVDPSTRPLHRKERGTRHNMQRWNRCEKVFGVRNVWGREVKWSYQTGDYVISSPTVANGVVYVSSAGFNLYAECQHRRQAVEVQDRQLRSVLASRGERCSLCRLAGRERVRLRPEVKEGWGQAWTDSKLPRPEAASPRLQLLLVRTGRNTDRCVILGLRQCSS
jgi:PQQ-like domain